MIKTIFTQNNKTGKMQTFNITGRGQVMQPNAPAAVQAEAAHIRLKNMRDEQAKRMKESQERMRKLNGK